VKVDGESDPAKATDIAYKLMRRDHVEVIIGAGHSGVTLSLTGIRSN
jgi:branched-chain amino acid transport system substrate-binding protein